MSGTKKANTAPRVTALADDALVTILDKTSGAISTIEFGNLKNLIKDSIKIGGRNLLKRQISSSCPNITIQGDTITVIKNGDSYWQIPLACDRSELEFGEDYTLSLTVENFPAGANWIMQGYYNKPIDIKMANGRCKATFKLTEDHLADNSFAFDDGLRQFPNGFQPITISKIKLERGNIATDWSLAPEDLINGGGVKVLFITLCVMLSLMAAKKGGLQYELQDQSPHRRNAERISPNCYDLSGVGHGLQQYFRSWYLSCVNRIRFNESPGRCIRIRSIRGGQCRGFSAASLLNPSRRRLQQSPIQKQRCLVCLEHPLSSSIVLNGKEVVAA